MDDKTRFSFITFSPLLLLFTKKPVCQTHLDELVGLLSKKPVSYTQSVTGLRLVELAQQLSKASMDLILGIPEFQALWR